MKRTFPSRSIRPGSASSASWKPFSYTSRPTSSTSRSSGSAKRARRVSRSSTGTSSDGSMPFGITRDARLLEPEDVGRVLAHVGGAGDHALGPVGHPALHAVDVGLRVLVHPALVAAVLGGVDRDHERRAEALGQVVAGRGHEPVVAVHHVEVVAVAHLHAGGQHVGVHPLDPGHELAQLARPLGLAHAVDHHAVHLLLGRRLLPPAGEHVNVHVLRHQVLGELAHVAGQAALDQGRVLPGEDQGAHPAYELIRGARSRSGARLRRAGSGTGAESVKAASAASCPARCSAVRRSG